MADAGIFAMNHDAALQTANAVLMGVQMADGAGEAEAAGEAGLNFSERVLKRMTEEPGPYHNFPISIAQDALKNPGQVINSNYTLYKVKGSVNGAEGTYEVGVNASGQIIHYFFNPK